eukprot:Hpha_TRINITY_DN15805_c0_g8::TRINITY_DN15805_c0_g8_i1::g.190188::m.190188
MAAVDSSGRKRAQTTLNTGGVWQDLAPGRLLAFLPVALARYLAEEEDLTHGRSECGAAVLLIDISGFSTVALELEQVTDDGAEALTEGLNAYFTRLLSITRNFGGDVVLFSGDAVVAVWFYEGPGDEAAAACILCANEILTNALSHAFTVATGSGDDVECRLGVHCGAAHGSVARHLVGGVGGRGLGLWKYVVTGPAVEQAGVAANLAKQNEFVCTREMFEAAKVMGLEAVTKAVEGSDCALLERVQSRGTTVPKPIYPPQPTESILSLAPLMVFDSAAAAVSRKAVGEMRTVSVVFIKLTGMSTNQPPEALHKVLQSAVRTVQKVLQKLDGVLNKVVMDDKGFIVLCLFGLPLHVHEDDAERSIVFGHKVSKKLQKAVGPTAIGIARAKVFCGMSGATWRNEYTVLGDGVNIAARLMIKAETFSHGKVRHVVCDEETARSSTLNKLGLALVNSDEVVLKGRAQPVVCHHIVSEADAGAYSGRASIGSLADAGSRRSSSLAPSLASHGSFSSIGSFSRSPMGSPQGTGKLSRAGGKNRASLAGCRSPRAAGIRIPTSPAPPPLYDSRTKSADDELAELQGSLGEIPAVRAFSLISASKKAPRASGLPSPRVMASGDLSKSEADSGGSDSRDSRSLGSGSGKRSRQGTVSNFSSCASVNLLTQGMKPRMSLTSAGSGSPRQREMRRRRTGSIMNTQLYGRDNEVAKLSSFLSGCDTVGECFVIRGDMLQGKTSLMRRAHELALRVPFFPVVMYPSEPMVDQPYGCMEQALRRHASSLLQRGEAVRDILPGALRHLAPLLHHVVRVHGLPLPDEKLAAMSPKEKRAGIANVCTALLSVAARSIDDQPPILFLVDDCHWLDTGSADVIRTALSSYWAKGSKAVVAVRTESAGEPSSPAMACALPPMDTPPQELQRKLSRKLSEISSATDDSAGPLIDPSLELAEGMLMARSTLIKSRGVSVLGLTPEDHRELVCEALRCSTVSPDLDKLLHQKSGGAPGLTIQMTTALRDSGVISYDSDLGASVELNQELDEALVHAVPAVEAAVLRVADQLNAEVRHVLNLAAVIGLKNTFSAQAVALSLVPEDIRKMTLLRGATALMAEPPGLAKVLDSIERLIRHGLLIHSSEARVFHFARPLGRDVIYFSILARERRELHSRVADAVAAVGGACGDPDALALHLVRATHEQVDYVQVADMLLTATYAAVRRADRVGALRNVREVVAVAEDSPWLEARSAEVHLHLAVCLFESGTLSEVEGALVRIVEPLSATPAWAPEDSTGCFGCLPFCRRKKEKPTQGRPKTRRKSSHHARPYKLRLMACALRAELALWACNLTGLRQAAEAATHEAELAGIAPEKLQSFTRGAALVGGQVAARRESYLTVSGLSVFCPFLAASSTGGMPPAPSGRPDNDFVPLWLRSAEAPRRPSAACTAVLLRCCAAQLLGNAADMHEAVSDLNDICDGDARWKTYVRVCAALANVCFPTRGSMSPMATLRTDSLPEGGDQILRLLANAASTRRAGAVTAVFEEFADSGGWDLYTPMHCTVLAVFADILGAAAKSEKKETRQSRGRNNTAAAYVRCCRFLDAQAALYAFARPAAVAATAAGLEEGTAERVDVLVKVVTEAIAIGSPLCGTAWRARASIAIDDASSPAAVAAACQGLPGAEGTQRTRADLISLLLESADEAQSLKTSLVAVLRSKQ